MIVLTSINPYSRIEVQIDAMKSWNDFQIYSLNSAKEIKELRKHDALRNISFIEVKKENIIDGKYIKIDEFFKVPELIKSDKYCLVNSDIYLNDKLFQAKIKKYIKTDAMIIGNRYDIYSNNRLNRFPHGYDVFIFTKEHAELLTGSVFALGLPWWDFYVPVTLLNNDVELMILNSSPYFTHIYHETRYDHNIWIKMAKKFIVSVHDDIDEEDEYDYNHLGAYCTHIKEYIEDKLVKITI